MKKPETTPVEQFAIDTVRTMRKAKGISQRELSALTELSIAFIANVESPKWRAKYNLNHLNEIAKALECSPKDFLPEEPL